MSAVEGAVALEYLGQPGHGVVGGLDGVAEGGVCGAGFEFIEGGHASLSCVAYRNEIRACG